MVAMLGLAACGKEAAGGSGTPGGSIEGSWTLVEGTVGAEPLHSLGAQAVTLTIEGGDASGTSACNSYFGTVEIDGATVRFGGLGGTEMACEPGVMTLERAYLAGLAAVREAAVEDDQLVLTGDGVELRFDPVEPVEPSALVGTPWVLEAIIGAGGPDGSASSPVGQPATLLLAADGKVTGSTGCNGFGSRYELTDDQLTVGEVVQTLVGCEPDVAAQEAALLAVLAEPLTVSIDGTILTLSAQDGSGLVYRVQDDGMVQEPLPTPGRAPAAAGWWRLRTGTSDGQPIEVGDHRIRLGLNGARLYGSVGCNHLGAAIDMDDTSIRPADEGMVGIGGTDMLCPELSDLEHAFAVALTLPLTYERAGDRLELQGDHGELVFQRLPDLEPEAIVGRTWVVSALVNSDGSLEPAVGLGDLVLADDGTFTAATSSCGASGTFEIEGDQVTVTSASSNGVACTATDERALITGSFVPVIDGDLMTIIGADGAGISYVVEHPGS